jgi:tetratricopeptide (TPR) repeat protein
MGLMATAALLLALSPAPPSPLPFINDDYPRAIAEARARNLPLFVEAWAPWCHTCRSMQAFVLTDAALKPHAGRFVWLAVDTEKETNAAVQEKYPIDAWPTFLIVEPKDERVALRWVGGATVPQLLKILDDGELAVRGGATGEGPEPAFANAERLYGERNFANAAKAYQEALAVAPAGWPRYSRAVESLLFALTKAKDPSTAVRVARDAMPRLRATASGANVAVVGLSSALELPAGAPARTDSVAFFEKAGREVIAETKGIAAADDLSGLYGELVSARRDAKDEAGARRTASEWASFLDAEAAKAGTPEARAVFDSHRLGAYIEMGEPQRAIPMLEASARDFPQDYNPPARLAVVYKEMGRWDEALAATERALPLVYGPRKLRVLGTRADVFLAQGDKPNARATLTEALATARALPAAQRSDAMLASIEKRIAAIE